LAMRQQQAQSVDLMTMKPIITLLSLIFFLCAGHIVIGQAVDNLAKNTKTYDDEQARFESELRTNMDSAEVYWKHAKVMASFTFNAQRDAWKYYEKSLAIDSSRVECFVDYGKYLEDIGYQNDARILYTRALKVFPSNVALHQGKENVDKGIEKSEMNKQLSGFGKAPVSGHPKASDYSKVTDFENLAKQTKSKKSKFYYRSLLNMFNADAELTDEQAYMLLIGFTEQKAYKPYSLDGDVIFKLNSEENFDEAISKARRKRY
jgi:tetratricopeptide (TPR) repeat protein